ncbi:MAG: zinc-ribbon domain-containing protein [Clostridium sp.]
MYCHKCGEKNLDDSIFCSNCGTKICSTKVEKSRINVKAKKIKKRNVFTTLSIIVVIGISFTLFNYKSILSFYYVNKVNKVSSFEEKAEILKKSMSYKVNDKNNKAMMNLILDESRINPSKSEELLLSVKNLLDNEIFKKIYFNVEKDKASVLFSHQKYKEAAEIYASCSKYDINVENDKDYIIALNQYVETELVKKTNIIDDISKYYEIGDLDNDGVLEVVVFEENNSLSLGTYIPNNIKLFKFIDGKYTLAGSIKSNATYCMDIVISKAYKDIKGVFLSGGAGAHSGIQNLYILKNDKFIPALDEDVYSLYLTDIKDINGDGILELSSIERDSSDQNSCNAQCLKNETWYNWDGNKGLVIVKQLATR